MELNGAKILYTIHTNIPLLGDFKITQTLVTTWIVMALLSDRKSTRLNSSHAR